MTSEIDGEMKATFYKIKNGMRFGLVVVGGSQSGESKLGHSDGQDNCIRLAFKLYGRMYSA